MKVFTFTVTRASTPERAALLQSTITQARRTAAYDFHWGVWASGCGEPGRKVLDAALAAKQIQDLYIHEDNVGQHVAWNEAMAKARELKADYFLRLDDDCEFVSKRWLKKLLDASVVLGDRMILSPTIRGLKNPPVRSQPTLVKELMLEFLFEAIGGICRLHPIGLIDNYTADVRLPLGAGDAVGIAKYCRARVIPMAYLKHVRIKHAKTTEKQELDDPQHFSLHAAFQHIPYIPHA